MFSAFPKSTEPARLPLTLYKRAAYYGSAPRITHTTISKGGEAAGRTRTSGTKHVGNAARKRNPVLLS